MPERYRPRHAAPRDTRRAVLLPGVLMAASGTAFGGLVALPAAAHSADPVLVTAASALAPIEILPTTPPVAEDLSAMDRAAAEQAAKEAAAARAKAAAEAAARASRDREAAEKKAAEEAAAKKAADAEQGQEDEVRSSGYFRPGLGRLTSPYGRRWGRLHAGIDLAAGTGSPIRAVTSGTVVSAGNEGGYGRCVRIRHADGAVTVYAHLSSISVRSGERVGAGQRIGREGSTGNSTGPHLHFEVHIGGSQVNPLTWLRKRGVAV